MGKLAVGEGICRQRLRHQFGAMGIFVFVSIEVDSNGSINNIRGPVTRAAETLIRQKAVVKVGIQEIVGGVRATRAAVNRSE